jgi:hypothetical protein
LRGAGSLLLGKALSFTYAGLAGLDLRLDTAPQSGVVPKLADELAHDIGRNDVVVLCPAFQGGVKLRHQVDRDPDGPLPLRPRPLRPRPRRLDSKLWCRRYCTWFSSG